MSLGRYRKFDDKALEPVYTERESRPVLRTGSRKKPIIMLAQESRKLKKRGSDNTIFKKNQDIMVFLSVDGYVSKQVLLILTNKF